MNINYYQTEFEKELQSTKKLLDFLSLPPVLAALSQMGNQEISSWMSKRPTITISTLAFPTYGPSYTPTDLGISPKSLEFPEEVTEV
jgi:hypothetical protein